MRISPAFIFIATITCLGCQPHRHEDAHAHHTSDAHAPDRIVLTDAQIRTAGIAWAAPETTSTAAVRTLSLHGEITLHPENTAVINVPGEATLLRLLVRRNQQVEKGTPVAIIRKPELLDWQLSWLEAQARIPFLQAEKDRYTTLQSADAGALKFAQQSEANLSEAMVQRDVAAARLKLFGIDPHGIDPKGLRAETVLTAPISGVISHLEIAPGSALSANQPICIVTNFKDRHADCWVFEKDLHAIRSGQLVEVQMGGERSVKGSILFIDPSIDPERRAARAHVAGKWPDHWVQGASVTAQIVHMHSGQSQAWLLDPESVIQDTEGNYVLRMLEQKDNTCVFVSIPVSVQKSTDGRIIASPSEPVQEQVQLVTKGAFYISAQGLEIGEH